MASYIVCSYLYGYATCWFYLITQILTKRYRAVNVLSIEGDEILGISAMMLSDDWS